MVSILNQVEFAMNYSEEMAIRGKRNDNLRPYFCQKYPTLGPIQMAENQKVPKYQSISLKLHTHQKKNNSDNSNGLL